MHWRVYLKVYEAAAVSATVLKESSFTDERRDLVFQHERELWVTFLKLDSFLSEQLLTVGENG